MKFYLYLALVRREFQKIDVKNLVQFHTKHGIRQFYFNKLIAYSSFDQNKLDVILSK